MNGATDGRAATGWVQQSVFLDVARAAATFMMLQGHTLDALLATELRSGRVFDAWTFVRGLTSCAFMFLSGFAFVFVTDRRHGSHGLTWTAALRRFRRFGFFLLLGYALHLPGSDLRKLPGMTAEQWRSGLMVDVLQCIAVMLVLLQLLVLVVRMPRYRAAVAASGATALLMLGPLAWSIDWTARLPMAIAAYLSPATGSLFPLVPWGAYILMGVVVGHLHASLAPHPGPGALATFGRRVLVPGGLGLLALAALGWWVPWWPAAGAFWANSPGLFCLRAGIVLLLLGALTRAVPRLVPVPYLVQAVARQSLVVYAVHLCIVYGSIWNPGLRYFVGPTLSVVEGLGVVVAIWVTMAALAAGWHWSRHHHPRTLWWARAAIWTVLVALLL